MSDVKGSSSAKATVHYKVVDKNGNVKERGSSDATVSKKSEQKIKRG